MKNLSQYIQEQYLIDVDSTGYTEKPKTRNDLLKILIKRLKNDKNANLNDIDISDIWNLNFIFQNLDPHNIDVSDWDTSKVLHMNGVFYGCKHFNCDLSGWKVDKVQDMYGMFNGCTKFKGDGLDTWNVNSKTNVTHMFKNCKNIKIPDWYDKELECIKQ